MAYPATHFRTVPSIHIQWNGLAELGNYIKKNWQKKRIFLVCDSGIVSLGLVDSFLENCKDNDINIELYTEIVADPPEEIVLKAVEAAKAHGSDIVVSVGGGSSLDVAKLVAVLAGSEQQLSDIYGIDNVKGERLPLMLVPTTAGTGSEVTNISIITTGETTKMGVVSPQLYADHVLLDASLTVGLPAIHTAATGIDAMVHAIEAYTTKHKKNPVSDFLAKEALVLLSNNLLAVCEDGTNKEAREKMLLGSMYAGQAFSNAPVAAVHALAYPLGGHFHVTHGLSNALMLVPVLHYNKSAVGSQFAELAQCVGAEYSEDVTICTENFINRIEYLIEKSGSPRRLREIDIPEDALEMLASDAMKQTRLLQNNPVAVTETDALALYKAAY